MPEWKGSGTGTHEAWLARSREVEVQDRSDMGVLLILRGRQRIAPSQIQAGSLSTKQRGVLSELFCSLTLQGEKGSAVKPVQRWTLLST